jgi:hypothetical protein
MPEFKPAIFGSLRLAWGMEHGKKAGKSISSSELELNNCLMLTSDSLALALPHKIFLRYALNEF